MGHNRFGEQFCITTWGEAHGKAIGVVIDGCPAGIPLDENMIALCLERRAPGRSPYTSPRKEPDLPHILSGVFEGRTTGTPISIMIENRDVDSSKYEPIKDWLRPGHANYGYLQKYGVFDYRGGGRASARETATRVAAGAVAQALLSAQDIQLCAFVQQVGTVELAEPYMCVDDLKAAVADSQIGCPDPIVERNMIEQIEQAMAQGDSLGGVVGFVAEGVPPGLGEPVFGKLDARLASALMGIPACKAVEIGTGIKAPSMAGSVHNDAFEICGERVATRTNHAGGMLGGISTGMPIQGRAHFKPTSSISKEQDSISTGGEGVTFTIPAGSRHDPCLTLRAPAVVEAMLSLVLADMLLLNRCSQI